VLLLFLVERIDLGLGLVDLPLGLEDDVGALGRVVPGRGAGDRGCRGVLLALGVGDRLQTDAVLPGAR